MGVYCCVYDTITLCQCFADADQARCRGYEQSPSKKKCTYWRNIGDGLYHCGHNDAQDWARKNNVKRRDYDVK